MYSTFSTTDVNLKVRYNPVVTDKNRLPYSFRKKRYHTGGGHNESRKYSIIVNIWHWTWEKIGYSFTHLWLCRSNQKTTWAIKENHQNVSEKCRITNVDGLPAYDSYGPYCSYSTSAANNWQTYQFGTTLYLQKIKRHMRPKIIQEKGQ